MNFKVSTITHIHKACTLKDYIKQMGDINHEFMLKTKADFLLGGLFGVMDNIELTSNNFRYLSIFIDNYFYIKNREKEQENE